MAPPSSKPADETPPKDETPAEKQTPPVDPSVAEGVEPVPATGEDITAKPEYARDPHDVGVPQEPGDPHPGPEDALASSTRGDYSSRIDSGPHLVPELIPEADRVPGGPISRMVPAGTQDDSVAKASARAV